MTKTRTDRQCSGFTLVELMMSITLLVIVFIAAGLVSIAGAEAYREATRQAEVDSESQRALARVIGEITGTGLEELWPDPGGGSGSSMINYYTSTDIVDGGLVLGPLSRIEFTYEEGETDNGEDDDGDGLIDEGMLVLSRDVGGPNELTVVLARGVREYLEGESLSGHDDNGNGLVDELGFTIARDGLMLRVMLTLERFDHVHEEPMVRTVSTSVMLRN